MELATVHVPDGSLGYFLGRFERYAAEDTPTGNPRHANMVERIAAAAPRDHRGPVDRRCG